MIHEVTLNVNGTDHEVTLTAATTLLEVIRDQVGLTGSKEGCDDSECGACMMLIGSVPVNSCSYLALQVGGRRVRTVEGIAKDEGLAPVQRALLDHGGIQCGFCTPGMLVSATALLESDEAPTRDVVRLALSGNLCRCTGYQDIVDAVASAGESSS